MATETGGDFVSKHLDRSVEARLIAIGTRRYYGVTLVTVAWIAAVISQWLFIMISENYSFASVQKYISLVLCAIPFLPFTAHKVLFSKTFYATVDHRIKCTQMRYLKGRDTKEALCIYFIKDNGKKLSVIYQLKDYVMEGLHCQDGDRVLFIRGLKYPLKFPKTDTAEFTCPVCGRTVRADSGTCKQCKFDYSQLVKHNFESY
ncbi:MAG: hypothetical protein II229_01410 [Clostridia bacterium]|nr:hypothetical protein [Clostridia bacterium]